MEFLANRNQYTLTYVSKNFGSRIPVIKFSPIYSGKKPVASQLIQKTNSFNTVEEEASSCLFSWSQMDKMRNSHRADLPFPSVKKNIKM